MLDFKRILATQEIMDPFDETGKNFLVKAEHWVRYRFAAKFLAKRKVRVVYDVTCGTGYGTRELGGPIPQVFGFDRNPDFLAIARQRYPQLKEYFYELDLDLISITDLTQERSVPRPEAVVCLETLEHLRQPDRLMAEFAELLPSGGWLICSVPNAKFERTLAGGEPANPFHLHLFTPEKVQASLDHHGFQVLKTCGQPLTNLLVRKTKRPTRKWFDRFLVNQKQFRFVAKLLAWPTRFLVGQSDSLLIICRKKGLSD